MATRRPGTACEVARWRKRIGGRCATLLVALTLLATASPAQEIDPHLEMLRPLLAKAWTGTLKSPDGNGAFLVTRRFEPLEKGRVVRLTTINETRGSSGEGFVFWDDVAKRVRLFFVEESGVYLSGTVRGEGRVITLEGTMSWPSPPPNPGVKQSYDFRNTLELLSETSMRDSWFQNAFGPWRPGHVIDFEVKTPGGGHLPTATPLDVSFPEAPAAGTERARTLQSVRKIRDISEQYATGGLYLITQVGDRGALFENENDTLLHHHWIDQTWRFCTIFVSKSADSEVVGRNWDNQNVGSVIVSRYQPTKGYASVSFSRAIDLGFPLNVRIDEMAASPWGDRLLLAPFYAYDGINDQGLFAGVTGVGQEKVKSTGGKKKVFAGYLVRLILDRCRTVDEALTLVDGFVPFDLDDSSLNCHFLVADASGRSVILEYVNESWQKTLSEKSWQVLTNKLVSGTSDAALRERCWRYRTASEELEASGGRLDWAGGTRILKDVSQSGTTWSVVYLPKSAEVFFSVYQDWDRIYRLRFPEQ